MKEFLKRINVFTILVALLTFVIGWQFGHRDFQFRIQNYHPKITVTNKTPPDNIKVDFKLFWDTWDLLSQHYLDKNALDPQKLFYGAIQGMVAAVGDPYTVFLPPDQQKITKEELNGSFEGVGIELGFNKDKRLVVIAPLDGTPAEKGGIKAGDMILAIDKKVTTTLSLPDAVNLIRGTKGSDVTLTILREGETDTRDITLTRDTIVVKSVNLTFKTLKSGKDIAVLKLSRFGERTNDEWISAVSELLTHGPAGIVLDVRNNPGGFLDGAVFIASEFLDSGDIVLQENNEGQKLPYKVNRTGKLLNFPLVVLINKGSASASEIVSGALQDRKRAKLVGEKSFGKGTIQEAKELPGGTGIHITTAKWLTPNGRWVNETEGLDPDVVVALPKSTDGIPTLEDTQMDRALELLN